MMTRHRAWRGFGCACLLLIAGARGVRAQQSVAPISLIPPQTVKFSTPYVSKLRQIYRTGDSERLIATIGEALLELHNQHISPECCDITKQYFLVMFVAPDPAAAAGEVLATTLMHAPMPETPELPGLHDDDALYEVFFADDLSTTIRGAYTLTREESAFVKQSGDFASALIGKLVLPGATKKAFAAKATGKKAIGPTGPSADNYSVAVTINRVRFPYAAKLNVRELVTYENPLQHIVSAAQAVHDDQKRDYDVRGRAGNATATACVAFSASLKAKIDATAAQAPCAPWPTDMAACSKAIVDALNATFASYVAATPACPADEAFRMLQEALQAPQNLKPVTMTTTIPNAPLVRFGYGLAAGYIARIRPDNNRPRAQIQSGKIVVDPFQRLLTMGVVNLTPWGYDSQRFSPTRAERFRFFAGAAFTPYFGPTGGVAYEITRYLSVTAGYARLWFDTPKAGEKIDEAPSSTNRAAPFELASIGACFIGVGYNFK